jgi:hypothetical protein
MKQRPTFWPVAPSFFRDKPFGDYVGEPFCINSFNVGLARKQTGEGNAWRLDLSGLLFHLHAQFVSHNQRQKDNIWRAHEQDDDS